MYELSAPRLVCEVLESYSRHRKDQYSRGTSIGLDGKLKVKVIVEEQRGIKCVK